jgi:hypothetical protein
MTPFHQWITYVNAVLLSYWKLQLVEWKVSNGGLRRWVCNGVVMTTFYNVMMCDEENIDSHITVRKCYFCCLECTHMLCRAMPNFLVIPSRQKFLGITGVMDIHFSK